MTLKRLILILLTLIAMVFSGTSLVNSWQEPQVQSRLELYQINIALQAQAWQPENSSNESFQGIREGLLGQKPLETATKQYQDAYESVKANLVKTKNQLAELTTPIPPESLPLESDEIETSVAAKEKQLQKSLQDLRKFQSELNLRLGILQAAQGQTQTALHTWSELQKQSAPQNQALNFSETAIALSGIWHNPPRLLPNAQPLIQTNLDGWFRSTALIHLYQLEQRQQALSNVISEQQQAAIQSVWKLALIATIPTLTALIGMILLVFLIGQRLVKGKESILAINGEEPWSTPWGGEIILQVFVLGFSLMGQVFVPLILSILPFPRPIVDVRLQAVLVLISYLLVASGSLLILYYSIRRFFPLPPFWFPFRFQGNWFFWGWEVICRFTDSSSGVFN